MAVFDSMKNSPGQGDNQETQSLPQQLPPTRMFKVRRIVGTKHFEDGTVQSLLADERVEAHEIGYTQSGGILFNRYYVSSVVGPNLQVRAFAHNTWFDVAEEAHPEQSQPEKLSLITH